MNSNKVYQGKCFCGEVELTVAGEPTAMGYCHCASCRKWSAGPVNAFILWNPDQIRVIKGADQILSYNKTPNSSRKWCRKCGGHLMTDHPALGLVDVYAATLASFPFKPAIHVNYGDTVLRMKDGLPKQMDFPAEMGGSGQLVEE